MPQEVNRHIPTYNGYSYVGGLLDIKDKEYACRYYTSVMLNRTQGIFAYTGLPDTIPKRNLELMLQSYGFAIIARVDGDLYAFNGGLGGRYNEYYEPTICTVANPYLNFSAQLKIDKDCVVIKNDSLYLGMLPMYNRYATFLAENDVSLRTAQINSRLIDLIAAPDDRTYKSAKNYLDEVSKGNLGVMLDNDILNGIKTHPVSDHMQTVISQLIELNQFLRASWYNELGLSANYNMKREAINSGEAQLGEDSMMTLLDDMMEQRQIGLDKVNKLFGTDISIDFANVWQKSDTKEAAEIAVLEQEEATATEPADPAEEPTEPPEEKEVKKDEA